MDGLWLGLQRTIRTPPCPGTGESRRTRAIASTRTRRVRMTFGRRRIGSEAAAPHTSVHDGPGLPADQLADHDRPAGRGTRSHQTAAANVAGDVAGELGQRSAAHLPSTSRNLDARPAGRGLALHRTAAANVAGQSSAIAPDWR